MPGALEFPAKTFGSGGVERQSITSLQVGISENSPVRECVSSQEILLPTLAEGYLRYWMQFNWGSWRNEACFEWRTCER